MPIILSGDKAIIRAAAFVEAAAIVDNLASTIYRKSCRNALEVAADKLRDKAVETRAKK